MFPTIGEHSFHSKKIHIYQHSFHSFIVHFNAIPWPNVTFFRNEKVFLSYSNPSTSPVSLILMNFTSDYEGIYYARVMNR